MKGMRPVYPAFLAAVLLAASIAMGTWMAVGRNAAQADPGTIVGIDTDASYNTKNRLGDIQECAAKAADDTFDVDVYVDEIPTGKSLTNFSYTLAFDGTRLEITAQDHVNMLLSDGGVPTDASEQVPDTASPHAVLASEFASPEAGPVKGVLGRYTLHVKPNAPSGFASISLDGVSLSGPQGVITLTEVRTAVIAVGTACPTPPQSSVLVALDMDPFDTPANSCPGQIPGPGWGESAGQCGQYYTGNGIDDDSDTVVDDGCSIGDCTVGLIDNCTSITAGSTFTFDVVVDNLPPYPAGWGLMGADFFLRWGPGVSPAETDVIDITGRAAINPLIHLIQQAPGSGGNLNDPQPL